MKILFLIVLTAILVWLVYELYNAPIIEDEDEASEQKEEPKN